MRSTLTHTWTYLPIRWDTTTALYQYLFRKTVHSCPECGEGGLGRGRVENLFLSRERNWRLKYYTFPGLHHLKYFITSSMIYGRRVWEILSCQGNEAGRHTEGGAWWYFMMLTLKSSLSPCVHPDATWLTACDEISQAFPLHVCIIVRMWQHGFFRSLLKYKPYSANFSRQIIFEIFAFFADSFRTVKIKLRYTMPSLVPRPWVLGLWYKMPNHFWYLQNDTKLPDPQSPLSKKFLRLLPMVRWSKTAVPQELHPRCFGAHGTHTPSPQHWMCGSTSSYLAAWLSTRVNNNWAWPINWHAHA